MTDRPIPFSAPMVAALRAGSKTQTRRTVPAAMLEAYDNYDDWCSNVSAGVPTARLWERDFFFERIPTRAGDRLWVRESYFQRGYWVPVEGDDGVAVQTKGGRQKWGFVPADDVIAFDQPACEVRLGRHSADPGTICWHKRLGRFMPRTASRMTLLVTDVRVQRLQEISEEDAIAEGYPPPEQRAQSGVAEIRDAYPIAWYSWLWDSINGPGSWAANPWVVAYSFTVARRNIDAEG